MKLKFTLSSGTITFLTIFLFLILPTVDAFSQGGGMAAYVDYRRRFYVFDHGQKKLLEEQEVKSFKIGGNLIAYVDYADNFKVYYNGEGKKLEIGSVRNYVVTNNLLAYSMTDILKVFDNGKLKTLSPNVKEFAIGDSRIVFFDYYFNSINGYYNGKIYSKRLRLVGETIKKMSASHNIAGLITAEDRNFWVFYRGQSELINNFVEDVSFKVGRDIMAYMDHPTRTFKAFYRGDIYDIENFQPVSYEMGDGRIVYVDAVGNFKTFYDGQIATILPTPPTFYQVKDSMIVFQELDRFKCFYEGTIYEVAPYMPDRFEFERDLIVYLDRTRNLQLFQNGETKLLQYGAPGMINEFKLVRDVIIINIGVNKNVIYWNGKFYE